MKSTHPPSRMDLINVTFLVAGTCTGGGMLALPVSTSLVGFVPSLVAMIISWLFMTATGLVILEVNLWMHKEDAHMITMASRMLGKTGRILTWIIYLFVCYASLVAYASGGGAITASALGYLFGFAVDKFIAVIVFAVVFGLVIYCGHHILGGINTILFSGMLIAYVLLIVLGMDEVRADLLFRSHWHGGYMVMSIPLLLTSFSFQYIVPSLTPMLRGNGKLLRFAIITGTTLALLIYLLWQWLVIGSVPFDGPKGLYWAFQHGEVATEALRFATGSIWISSIASFFAFFALVTSFLGMALGLFDFLSDGFHIPKIGWGNIWLGLMLVVPTVFFAVTYPRAFLVALDTSGGFGDTILNGIMPVCMVWVGRYRRCWHSEARFPGGKTSLICILIFACVAIAVEIVNLCWTWVA